MRGSKAKALRRIVGVLFKHTPGYTYPKGRRIPVSGTVPFTDTTFVGYKTGMMVCSSEAKREYKQLKKSLSRGGQ